jgi:hypothetical protein
MRPYLLKQRSGPTPYTQRDKNEAARKSIKALRKYSTVKVHVIPPTDVEETNGIPRIATAVTKKSAAGTTRDKSALKPQSNDQTNSTAMATAEMCDAAKI